MPCLALVLELHHPLPAPDGEAGSDWAEAGVELYWPILRALETFVDRAGEASITVAVSPSWTALASDPTAKALQRRELERRVRDGKADRELLKLFSAARGDGVELLRRWNASGAIDVIPTTATHTWLPSIASEPILARAQVALASVDHSRRFEAGPSGIWLPFLSYPPGLEATMAGQNLRFFGVGADAFLRGTVLPPSRTLAPMVTPVGVAAFAVSRSPSAEALDSQSGYGLDQRYADPDLAPLAAEQHARHFLDRWIEEAKTLPTDPQAPAEAICVAALSAHDLARAWTRGGWDLWLVHLLGLLADRQDPRASSLDRYLSRNPVGPLGRPGGSVGGAIAARPAGSDVFDRCRAACDLLTFALERRRSMSEPERAIVAEMLRSILRAQQLDWAYPSRGALDPGDGLRRASSHLARFYELASHLMSGRPDRIARPRGPAFLPDLDLNVVVDG